MLTERPNGSRECQRCPARDLFLKKYMFISTYRSYLMNYLYFKNANICVKTGHFHHHINHLQQTNAQKNTLSEKV